MDHSQRTAGISDTAGVWTGKEEERPMELGSLSTDPLCQLCLSLLRVTHKQILPSPFSAWNCYSLNPFSQEYLTRQTLLNSQLHLAIVLIAITQGKVYPGARKYWFYSAPDI